MKMLWLMLVPLLAFARCEDPEHDQGAAGETEDSRKDLTLLTNFRDPLDLELFQDTLLWIFDNVGSTFDLNVHIYDNNATANTSDHIYTMCVLKKLLDSGKKELHPLTMQILYLMCKADKDPHPDRLLSKKVLTEAKQCAKGLEGVFLYIDAWFYWNDTKTTPVLFHRNSTHEVIKNPEDLLPIMCQQYEDKPHGCLRPSPYPRPKPRPTTATPTTSVPTTGSPTTGGPTTGGPTTGGPTTADPTTETTP